MTKVIRCAPILIDCAIDFELCYNLPKPEKCLALLPCIGDDEMGVGVFSSDFDGTGTTFLVSGPLATDEDFAAYVSGVISENPEVVLFQAEDGDWNWRDADSPALPRDHPLMQEGQFGSRNAAFEDAAGARAISLMGREAWGQEEYDDFNRYLIEGIEQAAKELGLSLQSREMFSFGASNRFGADSEFVGVVDDVVEVGWRSWETDFVVGTAIGPHLRDLASDPEGNRQAAVEEFGAPSGKIADLCSRVTNHVDEYVRLTLMDNGVECRFRTSGYTSGCYESPENISDRKAELAQLIRNDLGVLKAPYGETLLGLDEQDRIKLVEDMFDLHQEYRYGEDARWETYLIMPVFDPESGRVSMWNPHIQGALAAVPAPDDVLAFCRDLSDGSDLIPIPRAPETESFFREIQERHIRAGSRALVMSAQEVAAGYKEDVEISYENDEGTELITQTLLEYEPQPALRP